MFQLQRGAALLLVYCAVAAGALYVLELRSRRRRFEWQVRVADADRRAATLAGELELARGEASRLRAGARPDYSQAGF